VRLLQILAALGLGLSAGAVLAEGAVLVPYWRSLAAAEFLRWYKENGSRLVRFFGPLEVIGAVLAIAAAVASTIHGAEGSRLLWLAALLASAVLLMFPIYFRSVNESFVAGSVPLADVPVALRQWALWHWTRTFVAILAFLVALTAFQAGAP
jgi:hypothetical protein